MEINWAEPPAEVLFRHENRGGKYVEFALALRENPEKWATMPAESALTDKSAQGLAQNIRRGGVKGFTKGDYEAIADGTTVYVRFKPTAATDGDAPKDPAKGPEDAEDPDDADDDEEDDDIVDTAVVRAWARTQGYTVSDKGRMGAEIVREYLERRAAGTLHDKLRPALSSV